jgi:hypothetical protein
MNMTKQTPPKLSDALFPELPTSTATRQRAQVSGNVSLKNVLGNPTPPAAAWQAGSADGNSSSLHPAAAPGTEDEGDALPTTKSKKSKGKQKQTLFTFGSHAA